MHNVMYACMDVWFTYVQCTCMYTTSVQRINHFSDLSASFLDARTSQPTWRRRLARL